jgi:hypothetical protein
MLRGLDWDDFIFLAVFALTIGFAFFVLYSVVTM